MKDLAKGLAALGRNGDSTLVHMQPGEVAGLQALAESQGTSLTINPETGLPEAFNLGNMLTSLLPTAVGFMLGGPAGASMGLTQGTGWATMAPIVGGALTGAALASAKGEDPLMGGLTGGLGGYGGAGLAGKITAAGTAPVENAMGAWQAQAANAPSTNELFPQVVASKAPSVPSAPFTDASGIPTAPNFNVQAGGGYTPGAEFTPTTIAAPETPQLSQFESGLQNVMSNPMDFLSQNKLEVGMPIGGALLSGLEPSDIYGKPVRGDEDKYDPYATLNLSGSTGLKLLAAGGSVQSGGLRDLYGTSDNANIGAISEDGYGLGRLNQLVNQTDMTKAQNYMYAKGGYLDGMGDGMSDSIPASIEGRQPARLADGEFVVPADVVSHIGNGSSKAGAKRLYSMLDRVRQARTGTKKQGKEIDPKKYMPA